MQCKSSVNTDVGWDAVKEVTAGAAKYQERFAGTTFLRVAVTNQRFTRGAREQAEANEVRLVERAQLEQLLSRHPINNHEFDNDLSDAIGALDAV